jgi:hypothetical protein
MNAATNTARTFRTNCLSTITITECRPVFLTETEQGFHVCGTFHDGISPLPPEQFSLATDDVGTPLLKRWWPSHAAWHTDDRKAILGAIEQCIIAD